MIQSINQGTIGSRLAIPALLLVPVAVLAHRFGLFNLQMATALLALSFLISLAILICSVIAIIRNSDPAFRANVRTTLLISSVVPLMLVGLIISIASNSGGNSPLIHDITTDTVDVPQFKVGVIERGSGSNSLAVEPDVIRQQLEAYPQIKSLTSSLNPIEAQSRAADIALNMGWEIYNNAQAGNAGIIEASDTTAIWGFVDDIVIRVRPTLDANGQQQGSVIDLRSVSRVGHGDIGANAKRIEKFIAAYQAAP